MCGRGLSLRLVLLRHLVLSWSVSGGFFEGFAEIVLVEEAGQLGHVLNLVFPCLQKLAGVV